MRTVTKNTGPCVSGKGGYMGKTEEPKKTGEPKKPEEPKKLEKDSEMHNLESTDPVGEEENASKKNWEFTKGVLFGILISAVCVMAVFLIRNGTIGFGRGDSETSPGAAALTSRETLEKLQEVADRIENSFLYEADGEQLTDYLFRGVAVGLKDPYASYYSAKELQNVVDTSNGVYYGIGITLLKNMQTGVFRIAGIYEGSPAWEAGLQTDDQILKVDDTVITGMDLSQVVTLIKKQEEVTLTISREGQEQEIGVVPSTVEIPTVSWRMLEEKIGYIRITEFDTVTVQQFKDAMAELEKQDMESLIVDVRDNPGGNLDSVCEILDELLPEGLIVYAENKAGEREEYTSDEEHQFTKPMAVLVNGNSASASELFAGVIQDYELGPVVGTQTYGKGVVQRTYLLDDGSALKLTTDKYYTAKGQDIDGEGVTPDEVVEEGTGNEDEPVEENTGNGNEPVEENAGNGNETVKENAGNGNEPVEENTGNGKQAAEEDRVLQEAIRLLLNE